MRSRFFLAALLCALQVAPARAQEAHQNLSTLKKAADEVLRNSSLRARNSVKAVFDYADALANAGQDKEALKYYDKGLQVHAWSLPHQLRFAQLLMKSGKKDLAMERANLVAENAEQDALVVPALALLGRDAEANTLLPPLARIEGKGPAVVLVAMGEVDALLLKAVLTRVQKELPIPVHIQQAQVKLPLPSREPLKDFLGELRESVLDDPFNMEVSATMKSLGIGPKDLNTDEVLLHFFRTLVSRSGGKDQVAKLDAAIEKISRRDSQWEAGQMREAVATAIKPVQQQHVRYLGITRLDIHTEGTNYVFALQGRVNGVVSYRRFMYDIWDEETPKRARLVDRFAKQCISSTGRLFGVMPCGNPTCVAAYPNSVEELDAKGTKLCADCQRKLQEAIEQEKRP